MRVVYTHNIDMYGYRFHIQVRSDVVIFNVVLPLAAFIAFAADVACLSMPFSEGTAMFM